ncbi:MAG: hypothetical protein Q9160_008959 [Pyrenula sp. 1 TL-2023]
MRLTAWTSIFAFESCSGLLPLRATPRPLPASVATSEAIAFYSGGGSYPLASGDDNASTDSGNLLLKYSMRKNGTSERNGVSKDKGGMEQYRESSKVEVHRSSEALGNGTSKGNPGPRGPQSRLSDKENVRYGSDMRWVQLPRAFSQRIKGSD